MSVAASPPPSPPQSSLRPWRLGVGMFLASALFFSGRLDTSDEVLMAATSHALATRASLTFPEIYGQTFTGYGIGTPLLGVPMAWLDRLLPLGQVTLLPLVNAALLGVLAMLIGLIVRHFARDDEISISNSTIVALLASPLLPASTTFGSEMLSAVGLVGAAWCVLAGNDRPTRSILILSILFAAFAVMARVAMVPFVLGVVVWGWYLRGRSRVVFGVLAGVAIGVAVRAAQNLALRGSVFAQGYDGQEMTTPILTGLHGLLFSPERGLFLFAPALVLAFIVAAVRPKLLPARWAALAISILVFSLLFHGAFWTWHGGWSPGPRFLLPAIALGMPLVVLLILRAGEWPVELPDAGTVLLGLALAWGAWGSLLYTMASPMAVWNEVWGFHQIEARWQFEPQLSLWSAVWQHAPTENRTLLFRALGLGPVLLGIMFAGIVVMVLLQRHVTWVGLIPAVGLIVLGILTQEGPRGWNIDDKPGRRVGQLDRRGAEGGRFSALLDLREHGPYTFHVKARGAYTIRIDGQTLLSHPGAGEATTLAEARHDVKQSGLTLIEVETTPPEDTPGLFRLYWSWPGGGRIMAPVGGQYVLPRELGPVETAATWVMRRLWLLGGFGLLVIGGAWGARAREPDDQKD